MHRYAKYSALLLLLLGCRDASDAAAPVVSSAPADAGILAGVEDEMNLLHAVRQATVRFRSTDEAAAAGYQATDQCVPGMGYHWVNPSLVDAVYDPMQPEVMLYASGPGGRLRLVAVEYIVIDAGQPRPAFGEHPFDIGGTPVPVPHWSQHVWLYAKNPDGVFTAYDPAVACP